MLLVSMMIRECFPMMVEVHRRQLSHGDSGYYCRVSALINWSRFTPGSGLSTGSVLFRVRPKQSTSSVMFRVRVCSSLGHVSPSPASVWFEFGSFLFWFSFSGSAIEANRLSLDVGSSTVRLVSQLSPLGSNPVNCSVQDSVIHVRREFIYIVLHI
ncbi:hypothetical protein Hanom_Chr01g00050951 [Helianthus anomalus]